MTDQQPDTPDPQPPVEPQPVELVTKQNRSAVPWPNPRPAVIDSTLEWAARMWLMDADGPGDGFAALAAAALDRVAQANEALNS